MSFYQNLDIYLIISCFCLFIIFEFCFLTSDARTMQYLCLSSARICGRWKYSSRPAILALKMQITFLQFWMQEKSLWHMKGFSMCYLKNLVRVFFHHYSVIWYCIDGDGFVILCLQNVLFKLYCWAGVKRQYFWCKSEIIVRPNNFPFKIFFYKDCKLSRRGSRDCKVGMIWTMILLLNSSNEFCLNKVFVKDQFCFVVWKKVWFEFLLNTLFHSRILNLKPKLFKFFTFLNTTLSQTHWPIPSFHYKILIQVRMKWRKSVMSVWILSGSICHGCSGNTFTYKEKTSWFLNQQIKLNI